MSNVLACPMCDNARINPDLSDDNDLSYFPLSGHCPQICRFRLASGGGLPVRILFEMYSKSDECWLTYGSYYPKFCPECGRRITE